MTTDHDNREISTVLKHIAATRRAPLNDRKDARTAFAAALKDPALVCERIAWLIAGHYGYGEMLIARRILSNPRMNRVADLSQLIATLEWQCPEDFARDAWKSLSPTAQAKLDRAITRTITTAEKEIAQ